MSAEREIKYWIAPISTQLLEDRATFPIISSSETPQAPVPYFPPDSLPLGNVPLPRTTEVNLLPRSRVLRLRQS
ncbi:hypothetical protein BH11PAT1_BH11PAT1_2600 [soil metagenome]